MDLHSSRSQVDFASLARLMGNPGLAEATTALHAYEIAGEPLARRLAEMAHGVVTKMLDGTGTKLDIVVIDRAGAILARHG